MPSRPSKRKASSQRNQSTLRIIGGEYRSRVIKFQSWAELRPTTDRVRETLFNWLMPSIVGARCLDLFCGTGILGFEALSRGASHGVAVDNSNQAARSIQENAQRLGCLNRMEIVTNDVDRYLTIPDTHSGFDIVFIDPPFRQNRLTTITNHLETYHWLNPNALIYIESEKELLDSSEAFVPARWQLLREKTAGQVSYQLYVRSD